MKHARPRTPAFLLFHFLLLPLLLPSCAGGPAPSASEPVGPSMGPVFAPEDSPPPPATPLDPSMAREGGEERSPVKGSERKREPVPWTSSELTFEPLPFDLAGVSMKTWLVDFWERSEYEPGAVRVCADLPGSPADTLFLELVPGASEVVWADGSRGTFRGIHSQGRSEAAWSVEFLTTVPPADPDIRSLAVAVDLHRATRVRRHEVSVGVGEGAAFEFGICGMRWFLEEDLEVREYDYRWSGDPLVPLFERGLDPRHLVTRADATGEVLKSLEISSTGGGCLRTWGHWPKRELKPPLRVTVDVPLETVITRIVLRLENLVPKR